MTRKGNPLIFQPCENEVVPTERGQMFCDTLLTLPRPLRGQVLIQRLLTEGKLAYINRQTNTQLIQLQSANTIIKTKHAEESCMMHDACCWQSHLSPCFMPIHLLNLFDFTEVQCWRIANINNQCAHARTHALNHTFILCVAHCQVNRMALINIIISSCCQCWCDHDRCPGMPDRRGIYGPVSK